MKEKIEIPFSKTKLGIIAIIVLCFALVCVYFRWDGNGNLMILERTALNTSILASILGIIFIINKMCSNTPAIIIDEHGITDNTKTQDIGPIQWKDISLITIIRDGAFKVLLIHIYDPEKYLELLKYTNEKNYKRYGTPFAILSLTIKIKLTDLEALLNEELEKKRNMSGVLLQTNTKSKRRADYESKKILLMVLIILGLNISCSNTYRLQPKWEYQVDNPLSTDITIKVDNSKYKIPAKSTLPIKLSQGKHTLTYNGSSVNFVTKVNSNKNVTIMNPTLSNYMIYSIIYVKKEAKNNSVSEYAPLYNNEYQLDKGGVVELPVKVLNSLFIDRANYHWTYGLDEEMKAKVDPSASPKERALILYRIEPTKLYREEDYIKEFSKEWPAYWPKFPVNSKPLSEQTPYIFPTLSLITDCDVKVKEYEGKWNKIIANPSDVFHDVEKLSHDVASAVVDESGDINKKYSIRRYNTDFKTAKDELNKEIKYLTNASSFIVK